jgi:uncharacterized circularly permuted ATP-grasp superfamily protein
VKICLKLFSISFLISLKLNAAAYNEVFDDTGQIRPQYQSFISNNYDRSIHGPDRLELLFPKTDDAYPLLDRPLDDAIRILPTPVILSNEEYRFLQLASEQRARTLAAFFDDVVYHDGEKVLASGLMSADELRSIFRVEGSYGSLESLRHIYKNVDPLRINFWFGPDMVRTENGGFQTLEDNIGLIGGMADVTATHEAFIGLRLNSDAEIYSPLRAAIETFLSDLPPDRWQTDVIALLPRQSYSKNIQLSDDEAARRRDTLMDMNIKIADLHEIEDSQHQIYIHSGQYKKVINFSDVSSLFDSALPVHSLLQAFAAGKTELMTSPGVNRLANKSILVKFDQLVRLYLGEQPFVQTAKTEWIRCSNEIDKALISLDQFLLQPACVIKQSDGSQGRQVYFPQNMTARLRRNLSEQILEFNALGRVQANLDLPYFVRQDFIDQSYIPVGADTSWVRFLIDYRPITFIYHGVPDTRAMIWGRANLKMPNSLANVSRGGLETVVLTPNLCADLLKAKP